MPNPIRALDALMDDGGHNMQGQIQDYLDHEDFYCHSVVKEDAPTGMGCKSAVDVPTLENDGSTGTRTYEFRMKAAAIESPSICLHDLRQDAHVQDVIRNTKRLLRENMRWLWSQLFQVEVIKKTQRHSVARSIGEVLGATDGEILITRDLVPFPRRINFRGQVVSPFLTKADRVAIVNPAYMRAAEQVVFFHKDTVHFIFPKKSRWAGEISWRNIPDREFNPDANMGFFRVIMRQAAKPVRPDLGRVVTVLPPGIKGFLWFWAWKLIRFVP